MTVSLPRKSVTEQSTVKLSLSILSTLPTGTSIVSPSADHACIHKCRSDVTCRTELSLVISACQVSWDGVADSVWLCGSELYYHISQSIVDAVHRVDPATDCPIQFCAHLLYDFCHFYSSLLLEGDQVCL